MPSNGFSLQWLWLIRLILLEKQGAHWSSLAWETKCYLMPQYKCTPFGTAPKILFYCAVIWFIPNLKQGKYEPWHFLLIYNYSLSDSLWLYWLKFSFSFPVAETPFSVNLIEVDFILSFPSVVSIYLMFVYRDESAFYYNAITDRAIKNCIFSQHFPDIAEFGFSEHKR